MSQKHVHKEQLKRSGLALAQAGRLQEAKSLYGEVCRIDKSDAEAWFMLGAINGRLGLMSEAMHCCHKAVTLNPKHVEAHYNLGHVYTRLGQIQQAEASYRAAARLKPDYVEAHQNLGFVLQQQGKNGEAIECYRKVLRLRPDQVSTEYMLAGLGGAKPPPKAPSEYVTGLFDNYAEMFDQHLVGTLKYRAPELLNHAIRCVIDPKHNQYDVLDLGCGTGLCGSLLKDIARNLLGVDLSFKMLEKARTKKIYSALLLADITSSPLTAKPAFDIIVAADVFVYIGDLAPVFEACKSILKTAGLFAFSIETTENHETYVLQSTDRYAHSVQYIHALSTTFGLTIVHAQAADLRKNKQNTSIQGHLFILRA